MTPLSCVEFFCGIGAFAEAARRRNWPVIAAFDQNEAANAVYHHNFQLKPSVRNLDSIKCTDIPQADLWWMSPPCTPFTVRGNQRDINDPRAQSFLNLIAHATRLKPKFVLIENVSGFVGSTVHDHVVKSLTASGYSIKEFDLCPTNFGVPMRRPRHFVIASQEPFVQHEDENPAPPGLTPLHSYLVDDQDELLFVDAETMRRYGKGFHIVDRDTADTVLTCFTRGYFKCRKSSGSLLAMPAGQARRLSPREITALLGFSKGFEFPAEMDYPTRWKLVGNSVCVRSVDSLLEWLLCRTRLLRT